MRLTGLAFAGLLLCGGVARAGSPTAAIDGNWCICQKAYTPSSSHDPIAQVAATLGYSVQFSNGKVSGTDEGNSFSLNVTLGAGAAQNMDLSGSGFTLPAIYQVQNGVMTVVVSFDGSRPTSFTDTSSYLVVVLAQPTQG